MCWIGHYNPLIAKENINCFKVMYLNNSKFLLSFYRKMCYNLNYEYKTKIKVDFPADSYSRIEYGFHSYNQYCKISLHRYSPAISVYPIDGAVRRALDFYIKILPDVVVVVDCIIPKGTLFFENSSGELVSEKIILTKINEINDYGDEKY